MKMWFSFVTSIINLSVPVCLAGFPFQVVIGPVFIQDRYVNSHSLFVFLSFICQSIAAPSPSFDHDRPTSPSLLGRATASATPRPVDCPKYTGLNFKPESCIKDSSVHGRKGGTAQIYYEIGVEVPDRSELDVVKSATARALSFYAANLKHALDVRIILVQPERNQLGFGISNIKPGNATGSPCYVAVRKVATQVDPLLMLQHTIAHELYHCVQFERRPKRPDLALFEDAVANFFEYYLYPWLNPSNSAKTGDRGAPHHYNSSKPLYDQTYSASLFQMYRHNRGFSLKEMDDWVAKRKALTPDMAPRRKVLADDKAMAKAFTTFAKAFHDKGIFYDSTHLPPKTVLQTLINVRTIDMIPPAQSELVLVAEGEEFVRDIDEMHSWTFEKYTATLPVGKRISVDITWTAPGQKQTPNVVVWKRVVVAGQAPSKWSRFKKAGILQSNCGSSNTAKNTYEFLVVHISRRPVVNGVIRFVREKDAKCKCPSPTPGRQVPRALTGHGHQHELQVRQEGNGTEQEGTWSARPAITELATRLSPTQIMPSALTTASQTQVSTPGFSVAPPPGPSPSHPIPSIAPGADLDNPGIDDAEEEEQAPEPDSEEAKDGEGEAVSCDLPPPPTGPSCLIGRWVANQASMEQHMKDPYWGSTGRHDYNLTAIPGSSYSITFGSLIAGGDDLSGGIITVRLDEKLIERLVEMEIRTGERVSYVTSTTTGGGETSISAEGSGFHPLGPESGWITRHVAPPGRWNSTQVIEEVPIRGPGGGGNWNYTITDPRYQRGPRGVYFSYNCTASTLFYEYHGSYARSYVFDRV